MGSCGIDEENKDSDEENNNNEKKIQNKTKSEKVEREGKSTNKNNTINILKQKSKGKDNLPYLAFPTKMTSIDPNKKLLKEYQNHWRNIPIFYNYNYDWFSDYIRHKQLLNAYRRNCQLQFILFHDVMFNKLKKDVNSIYSKNYNDGDAYQ